MQSVTFFLHIGRKSLLTNPLSIGKSLFVKITVCSFSKMNESSVKPIIPEEKVYQVLRVPKSDPHRQPEVLCSTSKASAQRLIAALAEQRTGDLYRLQSFMHPVLPGFNSPGMER
jgi:hypothetical protein